MSLEILLNMFHIQTVIIHYIIFVQKNLKVLHNHLHNQFQLPTVFSFICIHFQEQFPNLYRLSLWLLSTNNPMAREKKSPSSSIDSEMLCFSHTIYRETGDHFRVLSIVEQIKTEDSWSNQYWGPITPSDHRDGHYWKPRNLDWNSFRDVNIPDTPRFHNSNFYVPVNLAKSLTYTRL